MKEIVTGGKNITTDDKIPFSQLAAYGAGGIIPIALFNVAGILVGLMGNISLGLSAFWLGAILIVPRLWDAISDPIIGHLSDNTRTRWGRRRPYLLLGGIAVALSFVVIWWIPKGALVHSWFPTDSGFHVFQLVYILISLLIFFTAVTVFEIPHGALGMEMTTDYHERTRLFSAKSFVGNLFAMSTPWLFALASMEIFKGPGGNEVDGMRYVSILIAAVLIPLSFWWFFKLREPGFKKVATQKKTPFWEDMKHTASNRNFIMLTLTIFTLAMGFNFVSLIGSYIPIFFIYGGDKVAGATLLGINGTIWAITGVLAVFPLNWISPRLGKRKTLTIAILLMVLAQVSKIVCYNPAHPYLVLLPTILLSTGMLFFFTLGSSMVGDICDEDELKTGHRSEGSFYSVFWWFIKLGTALASLVAGALIVYTLFDETQVTKVDSLQGNIGKLRSKIEYWQGDEGLKGTSTTLLENTKETTNEAIDESKLYLVVLEKEIVKKQNETYQNITKYKTQRNEKLSEAISVTKSIIADLEKFNLQLVNTNASTEDSLTKRIRTAAIPLFLKQDLVKARLNSFELLSHLEGQSLKTKKSKEHYIKILENSGGVDIRLANINTYMPLEFLDNELNTIETEIVQLTQQSPYTLLMMRVVEIGLPLFLSIFSIFFIMRYKLTEKRSHEIKKLLEQKNL
ncbi:MAG: MFS transporter [Salinivirgaceae bacterium]|nr:MFS transporter [Salinivirgaceae bacterium]